MVDRQIIITLLPKSCFPNQFHRRHCHYPLYFLIRDALPRFGAYTLRSNALSTCEGICTRDNFKCSRLFEQECKCRCRVCSSKRTGKCLTTSVWSSKCIPSKSLCTLHVRIANMSSLVVSYKLANRLTLTAQDSDHQFAEREHIALMVLHPIFALLE